MIIPNPTEIELSDKTSKPSIPIETSGPSPPTQTRSRGRELWKKAAIKAINFVRMNNHNRFINKVYYGIGIEDKEFEEALDEKQEWVPQIN